MGRGAPHSPTLARPPGLGSGGDEPVGRDRVLSSLRARVVGELCVPRPTYYVHIPFGQIIHPVSSRKSVVNSLNLVLVLSTSYELRPPDASLPESSQRHVILPIRTRNPCPPSGARQHVNAPATHSLPGAGATGARARKWRSISLFSSSSHMAVVPVEPPVTSRNGDCG